VLPKHLWPHSDGDEVVHFWSHLSTVSCQTSEFWGLRQ
jgi:hypothetical protein